MPTVREWVEQTVFRVRALCGPTRAVELGCGNGMILLRQAAFPEVEAYGGADLVSFSKSLRLACN